MAVAGVGGMRRVGWRMDAREGKSGTWVYRTIGKVTHESFGKGIVLNSSGSGPDEHVTIAFEGEGIKRLEVWYANLQRV